MNDKTTSPVQTWIYWIITLPLFMIYSGTAFFFSLCSFTRIDGQNASGKTHAITALLMIGFAVSVFILLHPVFSKNDSVKTKILSLRVPLTAVLALFFMFLFIDTKPLSQDYSEKDIVNGTPEAVESFATLKPLVTDMSKTLDLDRKIWSSHDFLSKPETHEADIMNAWNVIADKRAVIDKLSTYGTVSDVDPTQTLKIDIDTIRVMPVLNIQTVYMAYAALKIKKGEPQEGLSQLYKLYDVARKEATGACVLLHKMLWLNGVIGRTIEGAYLLSTMEYTDNDTKKNLAAHFTPLTDPEISLKKPIIGEYVFLKNTIKQNIKPATLLSSFDMIPAEGEKNRIKKMISTVIYYTAFNKNRTIAQNKVFFDRLIAGSEKVPPDAEDAKKANTDYLRNPTVRNFAGWMLSRITNPSYSASMDKAVQMKIKSDLLAIHLHELTGDPVTLNDIYTGKPYNLKRDEKGLTVPGKDGTFGTNDDVSLVTVKP